MSNILIITAHPSEKNLTKGITDILVTEKEAQAHKVEVVDLYKDRQLPFLEYATNSDMATLSDEQNYYQEKVKWADDIIFVYPFWWGTTPAILKNWIDSVLTMGFAAKYDKNGRPVGLLKGKSVRVFSTSGAPTFIYCLNGIRRANKKTDHSRVLWYEVSRLSSFWWYGYPWKKR
jgi:NAD(P)H dehydrogenase (quinone)